MDHVECKIVNNEGEVVPIGEEGELCLRGFLIIPYYWNDAKKTAEVNLCNFCDIFSWQQLMINIEKVINSSVF